MSRRRVAATARFGALAMSAIVIALASQASGIVRAQAGEQQAAPRVGGVSEAYATPPLRSFPRVATPAGAVTVPEGLGVGVGVKPRPQVPGAPDPVRQSELSLGEAPAALSAPVVSQPGQNGADPPDPVGDVGPNDYVQMVNSAISVFNKQGTQRAGFPVAINSLWSALPAGSVCATRNDGDPIVLYDQQADRWMVSQFTTPRTATGPGGTFPMCIAYSQTGDPTGAYWAYQFNLPRSQDYMKYGIWPDGLYMSTWEGGNVGIYAFDRAAMLGGAPATFIDLASFGAGNAVDGRGGRILPADWDGATPPAAGAPIPFAMMFDDAFDGGSDRLQLFNAHADFANPAASFFAGGPTLNTAPFDTDLGCGPISGDANRLCIPQPNTTQLIDALANRLMHRLQYRNFGDHESMVVSHTVDADGNNTAGVRWYELRNTGGGWAINQQGTYAPMGGVHRWMPSAAMDGRGNIAIGYSVSDGTSTFPGLRYTGRAATDPLGSMPAGEQTLVPGAVSQTTSARWGDYSALTVDPVDDCTFWYTGEIASFATQLGAFRFSDCGTDLAIRKTVTPEHPVAGQEIVYTITVDNLGDITAGNVRVVDVLPAQVTYLANTDTCTNAAGTLTCQLGSILPHASKSFDIKVRVNSDLGGPTSITNTATVSTATADSNPSNDSVSLTHLVNELADLAVTKFCKPDTAAPAGTTGTCQIFVHNYGPSAARLVNLTDTHVSNGSFTIGTVPAGCVKAGATVTCSLGKILVDTEVRIDIPITTSDGVDVNDTAHASSVTPDDFNSNNDATAGLTFTASADVSITKSGPASATAGTDFAYTLNVTNNGPSAAAGVSVTDKLPSGVTFLSATATQGTTSYAGGTVTWDVGNLASGVTRTLTINVHVNPQTTGQLVNSATVSAITSDPNTSNNSTTWTTTVNSTGGLTLQKIDTPDPVIAGNNITYTLTVGNAGPSTAFNVVVTDALPAGTSLVSAVGGTGVVACAAVLPNGVSCDVGTLDPGQSKSIFITAHVASTVPNATVLHNVAAATASNSAQANASSDTAVQTRADLWMEKTGMVPAGNPAGALIYTLIVHNHPGSAADSTPTSGVGGPSDAQGVFVIDTLPLDPKKLEVQFLSPGCTYILATHQVRCETATVPYATSVSFQIQVQIKGSVGAVTNTAVVNATTVDPNTGNNTDTVNNVVQGSTGKGPRPR